MSEVRKHTYAATGILRLDPGLPVEAIGAALMDGAADVDENTSVSIDIDQSLIEIEAIVRATDEPDALASAQALIHRICEVTKFPVEFAENRRPSPSEWHLVDDTALPPLVAP